MFLDKSKLDGLEFTDDGYLISNGCYMGVKKEDRCDFDWHSDLDVCRDKLHPVIDVNALINMLDYTEFIKNK